MIGGILNALSLEYSLRFVGYGKAAIQAYFRIPKSTGPPISNPSNAPIFASPKAYA